ncbi:Cytochrome P450 monooxygenase [Pseudocercospora fuligena]|uniref:Cytochrome P450 monooxygenase n=1 Tax=Pseudocercospora fuligena TaxID=685502 RepID=A0A8H6RP01_9PEZI|nr:Cytochrome P450 monooxygenase [Pseudocercospora fuligena]
MATFAVAAAVTVLLLSQTAILAASKTSCCMFIAVAILGWTIHRTYIRPRWLSPLRDLPRFKSGWPLICHGFSQFSEPRGEAYLRMIDSVPNQGLVYFQGFWGNDQILLTSPEGIAEVLVHRPVSFPKAPAAQGFLMRLLGKGAIPVAEGEEHKRLKKILMPAFSFRSIQDMVPTFWSKAIEMASAMEQASHGTECSVDAWAMARRAMLDTIVMAAVGIDLNILREDNELLYLYDTAFNVNWRMVVFMTANAIAPRWIVRIFLSSIITRMDTDMARLAAVCRRLVVNMDRGSSNGLPNSILHRLAPSNLTTEELGTHLMTVVGAGFEPTAGAFTWALWFLASHPQWQSKLRQELRENDFSRFLTGHGANFDACETLAKSPILNAVCSETLRLLPPSPIVTRVPPTDTTILGHFVPAGTRIFIVPGATNRMDRFYGPSANSFEPSRWIDPDSQKANKHGGADTNYAFSTFLHGPRKCLGQSYVTWALRAFVAVFVGRFDFRMANAGEVPVPCGVTTVRPRDGLRLALSPIRE